jgi:7-carboxy-7-deazaguanine synthase
MDLIVNEIFYSIQGETTTAGLPSVFVRLTGCNLNCSYCDSRHARSEGTPKSTDAIIGAIERYPCADHVTITGGEPLLQNNTRLLMRDIIDRGWRLQIETNGSILLKDVPGKARKIVDVKTPSSGEKDSFEMRNLKYLSAGDEMKFVIATGEDYEYSKDFIHTHQPKKGITVNFSPARDTIPFAELAEKILSDRLPVRLNLQLHTIIWGRNCTGR